jgi:hypothetical protein
VEQFKGRFKPSGERRPPKEAEARAMEEGEEEQDKVKRYRRSPEEFDEAAGHAGRSPAQSP